LGLRRVQEFKRGSEGESEREGGRKRGREGVALALP